MHQGQQNSFATDRCRTVSDPTKATSPAQRLREADRISYPNVRLQRVKHRSSLCHLWVMNCALRYQHEFPLTTKSVPHMLSGRSNTDAIALSILPHSKISGRVRHFVDQSLST
jgi:hypothetical protein